MADIRRFPMFRHLRSEPSSQVFQYRRGKLVRSGKGLAFWFNPLNSSIAELPLDNREQSFFLKGRSQDFQQVNVQGDITYRIDDPERLAAFVDFSLDLNTGRYTQEPLEALSELLTQLAQQFASDYLMTRVLEHILKDGTNVLRDLIINGLGSDESLEKMGLKVISVRVAAISPSSDVEKALQTPAREAIQQRADEAMFERRALAVEKERAISENELATQIELAKQEEALILQRGANERRNASEQAEAERIRTEAQANELRLMAEAEATQISQIEAARVQAEEAQMAIYREMSSEMLLGLAAKQFASKLETIEHLNITPDMLGTLLGQLLENRANGQEISQN